MRDPGNEVNLDSRNKKNNCYPRVQALSVKCLAEETDQKNKLTRYYIGLISIEYFSAVSPILVEYWRARSN